MAPSRRIVAILALAVLALSACSSKDAKESDIVDAMTDAGLSDAEARCVGDGLMKEFDQDQLNDIAAATDPEDFPDGTSETIDSVLEQCVSGAGSTDTTDTTGADGTATTGESGSTTTTAG
jgi:hypothetical protein